MKTPLPVAFALFDTTIGSCGIVWGAHGIVGMQLPEGGAAATRERVQRRFPRATAEVPPVPVQRAIDLISQLLQGKLSDLSEIDLDMTAIPPFNRRVYELARRIQPGRTMSYGEVARHLGADGAARAVGQALGGNPFPIIVPCHRVLASGGMGGFSAAGGADTKRRLLTIEGVPLPEAGSLFDDAPSVGTSVGRAVKPAARTASRTPRIVSQKS